MSITDDPIEFELFKNALFAIADEMALTVFRTTYSGVLKDNMDYSTAFCDADGKLVAQGLTLPGPSRLDPDRARRGGGEVSGRHRAGRRVRHERPVRGRHAPARHLRLQAALPRGRRLAFAATICHHTDVGGRVAGSNASDSTEIYQEGLRIPPLKLYDAGRRNETLFALIEKNVRLPVRLFGDLRAQLAACHIAEQPVQGPDRALRRRGGHRATWRR